MECNLTWDDLDDIMVAVSVRLCMDDDAALLERPSKRQRLVPVSTRNPTPAPEALPEMAWSGWAEVAKEAGLNDAHGPGLVHSIAQLYAKQQRYAALASKQRPQSPLPANAELQRLTPMLRLAQVGAVQASAPGEAEQPQQPQQQHQGARPSGDLCAAQPSRQAWPDGVPTATQLLESQADELVAAGTVPFKIAGKDWIARGDRGKEVHYLVLFQGRAAGEEDWKPARLIRKSAGGAAVIAEYEQALEAGDLDASQQQLQADNPGAAARASQQSQQAAPPLPAIPESAPRQRQTSSGAPAEQPLQQVPEQQRRQQRQKQPAMAQPQVQETSNLRPQHGHTVPRDPEPDQASLQQPQHHAAADAAHRSQGDAAVAGTVQSQAVSHVLPSQPPTDSQWLAAETQTQAPGSSTILTMDMVPFTQGSQPSKPSDGAHRRPLPAPTAAAAAAVAAGSAPTASAAGSAAAGAPQPASAPSAAPSAEAAGPSASPADASIAGATAPAAPQVADGLAAPQHGTAASGFDEDSAPPDPRTRLGVEKLLRRLSSHAASPAHRPQPEPAAQAQPASTQQPPALPPAAKAEQHPEQKAAPLQHSVASGAPAASTGGGTVTDQRHVQPCAASGPGTAVAGSGTTGAAPGRTASSNSAISLDSSNEDDDEATLELKAHLQPDMWAGARITRARKDDDGNMYIVVKWDDDKFEAAVPNQMLKAEEHCRLKLLDFYESKIKAVSRKTKETDEATS